MSETKKITIKRYNTINALGLGMKLEEIDNSPLHIETPYQVDDSNFQPISETLKTLGNNGALTDKEIMNYYDFPNGKDTGIKIPIDRTHGDLADISEEIKKTGRKTKKAIQDAIEEQKFNEKLNAITNGEQTS